MMDLPIGVFDSGIGGLTVLRALRTALPYESFLYLGDTARLPYGTKSRDSVVRYAVQSTQALWERGIKLLVVACNTASAAALDALQAAYPGLPVVGVAGRAAPDTLRSSPRKARSGERAMSGRSWPVGLRPGCMASPASSLWPWRRKGGSTAR
jgi:glutamate racemase